MDEIKKLLKEADCDLKDALDGMISVQKISQSECKIEGDYAKTSYKEVSSYVERIIETRSFLKTLFNRLHTPAK